MELGVNSSSTFIVATYGSLLDDENLVSFGWKVSLQDEMPLAEHSDPAFGKAMSFCAEGYRLLSLVLHNTLELDWDVLAQAAMELKTFDSEFSIQHIKSHQDDHTPMNELSFPARMNIAADILACMYRKSFPVPRLHVPQIPINLAQLEHSSHTVSSHYFKSLRDIVITPKLTRHIMARN
eukprot:11184334-Ditylum_brightwellii.AAC.1